MIVERDVAPGVHRVATAFVNFYLVEDAGRVTVVDAGMPRSWDALHAALTEIQRRLTDVAALVLTHGHFDHVGFAERLRRETSVPVMCHHAEVSQTRRPLLYRFERLPLLYGWRPDIYRNLGSMVVNGALRTQGLADVRTFRDGEQLDVPGRPTVVHTPGHTIGHAAFHLPERSCVIVGDALATLDPYTGRRGPRLVARAATADSAQARTSLERLGALPDADVVLCGHGDPWREGIADAAGRALEQPQA